MTTKAQQFRNEQTRAAMLAKPKAAPKRKPRKVDGDTADLNTSPTDQARTRKPDARGHAGRRGGAVLETPATEGARPSRKSTRKSADHVKQTTNLQLKATMASQSPTSRNARGAVGKKSSKATTIKAPRASSRQSTPSTARSSRAAKRS